MKTKIFLLISAITFIFGCKPEIDEFKPDPGSADFSKYISIGNSLTAGYADGDLYKSGQEYSFPNILAGQFKQAGGGEFKQPYMHDEVGFGSRRVLGYSTDCLGVTSLGPVMMTGNPDPENFVNMYAQGPFNNMGVPGIKSFHLAYPGYGVANPYFGRFASAAGTSVLKDAMKLNHTFFSFFIGSNDVLAYALSGGEEGPDSITTTPVFQFSVMTAIDSLTKYGAKGVVATIPDITDIPYFTTVPSMGLYLVQAQADQLNAAYAPYNAGATAVGVPQIVFHAGYNGFIIQETDAPYSMIGGLRQIKASELILLSVPQDSLKCKGWGSQKPIPGGFILDEQEINAIKTATAGFNGYLTGLAGETGLAVCDINAHFKKFTSGLMFDGIKFSVKFVTGGLFSLDGVHPNPRGQAIMANYFIDAINDKYGAAVSKVPVSQYPGLAFP